jgi:hypothetical protein
MFNAAFGRWEVIATPTALNTFGNYIDVTVPVAVLNGTQFALAIKPQVPVAVGPANATPAQGGVEVDPMNVNFTWTAVPGATGYKFNLANADEQIGSDHFGVLTFSANTDINAVSVAVEMEYDTTYYWRVTPYNASGDGPATVFMFKTMAEPVATTTAPPVTITNTTVTQTVTSTQVTVTVPTTTVTPIPAYLIWAVIAVGAILIIVVIVLIVRTRRIG